MYLNQIMKHIHQRVRTAGGHTSATHGDKGFFVWPQGSKAAQGQVTLVLETALRSLMDVYSDPWLIEWETAPLLQGQHPGFHTDLRIGLHRGSCIECVVGSNAKIEPMFVGPDTILAAWLEHATRFYDVKILASAAFVTACDPTVVLHCFFFMAGCTVIPTIPPPHGRTFQVSNLMRRVDRVVVGGVSSAAFDIFAYDLSLNDAAKSTDSRHDIFKMCK